MQDSQRIRLTRNGNRLIAASDVYFAPGGIAITTDPEKARWIETYRDVEIGTLDFSSTEGLLQKLSRNINVRELLESGKISLGSGEMQVVRDRTKYEFRALIGDLKAKFHGRPEEVTLAKVIGCAGKNHLFHLLDTGQRIGVPEELRGSNIPKSADMYVTPDGKFVTEATDGLVIHGKMIGNVIPGEFLTVGRLKELLRGGDLSAVGTDLQDTGKPIHPNVPFPFDPFPKKRVSFAEIVRNSPDLVRDIGVDYDKLDFGPDGKVKGGSLVGTVKSFIAGIERVVGRVFGG